MMQSCLTNCFNVSIIINSAEWIVSWLRKTAIILHRQILYTKCMNKQAFIVRWFHLSHLPKYQTQDLRSFTQILPFLHLQTLYKTPSHQPLWHVAIGKTHYRFLTLYLHYKNTLTPIMCYHKTCLVVKLLCFLLLFRHRNDLHNALHRVLGPIANLLDLMILWFMFKLHGPYFMYIFFTTCLFLLTKPSFDFQFGWSSLI